MVPERGYRCPNGETAGKRPNPDTVHPHMTNFEGYVDAGASRVWVSVAGDGPPLLLLMGMGGHTGMWAPLRRQLPQFQTIAYDSPGTGRSPAAGRPTMGALAGVATGVLDALGVERTSVLGYSFGGAVAQQLAHQSAERVERMVLAATMCGVGAVLGWPALWMTTPARYWSPQALQVLGPTLYGGRQRAGVVAPMFNEAPPDPLGYLSQIVAIGTWTSLPWLHRLRVPTLVLAGDDDPLVPLVNARLLARRIPGARLHVVAGGGHLLLLDSAVETAPIIESFVGPDRLVNTGRPTVVGAAS